MRVGRLEKLKVIFLLFCCSTCLAQSTPIGSAARRQIDAGNQAWIDGMKQGNAELIAATYTPDAVDCNPEGDCIRGRAAIDEHIKEEMTKLGKADMASVTSVGSVEQGPFIYEWGQATAPLPRWEENTGSVSHCLAGAAGQHLEDFSQSGDSKQVMPLRPAPIRHEGFDTW